MVQEIERNREGEPVLMNDVWHIVVIDFRHTSSSSSFQGLNYVFW